MDSDTSGLLILGGGLLAAFGTVAYIATVSERERNPSGQRPAMLVKGNRVKLEMSNGRIMHFPAEFGFAHDPTGTIRPRCHVFIGSFRKSNSSAELTNLGRRYFGDAYEAKYAAANIPRVGWHRVGYAVQIFYRRPASNRAAKYPGRYYHPFKTPVSVSRSGSFYRLDLPGSCILNERGFVSP